MTITPEEFETIKFCVAKCLEINNHNFGEMTANLILGPTDRSEDFLKLLGRFSVVDFMEKLTQPEDHSEAKTEMEKVVSIITGHFPNLTGYVVVDYDPDLENRK